jgi:hypothetical protein
LPAVGRPSNNAVGAQLLESVDDIALTASQAVTQLDRGDGARDVLELLSDLVRKWIGLGWS